MRVRLSARGNPDHHQHLGPLPGVPSAWVEVRDLASASKLCLAYIAKHGLGGGNWVGGAGDVRDDRGKVVARVSYNGRVWPPEPWRPGQKPLLEAAE